MTIGRKRIKRIRKTRREIRMRRDRRVSRDQMKREGCEENRTGEKF
jgi:hypothetical protein